MVSVWMRDGMTRMDTKYEIAAMKPHVPMEYEVHNNTLLSSNDLARHSIELVIEFIH